MANPFVHLELATTDLTKAKEFYSGLFGWTFADQDMGPMGIYSTFAPDSGPMGGAYSMPGMAPGWMAYVGVEDIDVSTDKAKELGATVVRDVTEIPNIGWMSVVTDPTGATIAMFEPLPRG